MSYKVDLHTHSYGSPDGALRAAEYRRKLESGALDFIAITDHDRIDSALQIRGELDKLGDRIIIGEEISTADGELIGLYLTDLVPAGLSAVETTQAIRGQGGLVYVPHPFETVRSGMPEAVLGSIAEDVDIVETYNGRAAFQDCGAAATAWAEAHDKPVAASSDAHGRIGWGRTYSELAEPPTRDNLARLLDGATYGRSRVGIGILYPKLNRIRKLF